MIEIQHLRKEYRLSVGLDDFSLTVPEGELFGLVGPNGAGKTTLIKILATLLRPTGGSVKVAGEDLCRRPSAIKGLVGYMPDMPGLYHDMRVREFLEFFAVSYKLPGPNVRRAVQQALNRSGLGERAESFVEQLSFGMKQRLVLERTLLHSPRLLLLDEPATGLDPAARKTLREQLRELHRQGTTILLSSHILSDLEHICTRVAFIARGRNASDVNGNSVLVMQQSATRRRYAIDFTRPITPSDQDLLAKLFPHGVTHHGPRAIVEARGEDDAARALRELVMAGLPVVAFQRHDEDLEEHYRRTFVEDSL